MPGLPIILAATAAVVILPAIGIDTFYALYTGRIVASGGPPHHEVLTTASGHVWTDQQWLGQWFLYESYRIGGYRGLTALAILVLALAGLLFKHLLDRDGGTATVLWSAAAVAAIGMSTTAARTQTLALPLFVLLLSIVTGALMDGRWRRTNLWLIPILVLWANIHGSVLMGAGIAAGCMAWIGVRLLMSKQWPAAAANLLVGISCLAAVAATPYGLSTVGYYRSLMGNGAVHKYASEWRPLAIDDRTAWAFLGLLALSVILILLDLRHRRTGWRIHIAAATVAGGFAFYSVRYTVWAAIVIGYVASRHGRMPTVRPGQVALSVGRAGCAALLVLAGVALATTPATHFTKAFPVRVATAASHSLAQDPQAVALTDQWTAATLLWLDPHSNGRIAFDIRYEQYPASALVDYAKFLQGTNVDYACGSRLLAVSTTERPKLVAQIHHNPAWTLTYDGEDGIVAVRTPGVPCR